MWIHIHVHIQKHIHAYLYIAQNGLNKVQLNKCVNENLNNIKEHNKYKNS